MLKLVRDVVWVADVVRYLEFLILELNGQFPWNKFVVSRFEMSGVKLFSVILKIVLQCQSLGS